MYKKFKDERSYILHQLRMSKNNKEKANWSREIGAGFIKEDITGIEPLEDKSLRFTFSWGSQNIPVSELNLRETEEAIKYLEEKSK